MAEVNDTQAATEGFSEEMASQMGDMLTVGQQQGQDARRKDTTNYVTRPFGSSRPNVRVGGMDDTGFAWPVGPQDFNPAGFRPNESRSTQVGKYGGAPLFAATIGFPTSVIASRLGALARKQEKVDEAIRQYDPMAGVEDVNAPEHREDFLRQTQYDPDSGIYAHVNDTIAMWGEKEGYRRLLDRKSKESQALYSKVQDWNTVARHINQATKAADLVLEGTRAGKMEYNEDLIKQAENVRRKTGEYEGQRDVKKLAKELPVFLGTVAFYDQIKADGISDLLKNAGTIDQFVAKAPELGVPGIAAWLTEKTHNRDTLVDALTDAYAPMYHGLLTRDEVKKRFSTMAQTLKEQDLKTASIPGYADAQAAARERKTRVEPYVTTVKGEGVLGFTPYQTTGGKEHNVLKANVRVGDKSLDIYAPSMKWDEAGEDWVLEGRSLNESDKATLEREVASSRSQVDVEGKKTTTNGSKVVAGESVDKKTAAWTQTAHDITTTKQYGILTSVPVSDNSDAMMVLYDTTDPYKIVSDKLKAKGHSVSADKLRNEWGDKAARAKYIKMFSGAQTKPTAGGSTAPGPGHKGRTSTKDPLGLF